MSLDHLREDLADHIAKRPVQPGPVSKMTPKEYAKWSRELAEWAEQKAVLQGMVDCAGFAITPLNLQPTCTRNSGDYYFRPPLGRKRKAA